MSTLSTPASNIPEEKSSQSPSNHLSGQQPIIPSVSSPKFAQSITSAYLTRLLQRHTDKANFVLSFTAVKQQQCEEEIRNGRYSIHKRDWSAEQERLKASRTDPRNTAEIIQTKRQLEEQLQQIQGQIQENERSGKTMSDQERKAFLKRMQKQKKQLLRKKEQNARLLQERKAEEERRERQQQQRQEAERRARKQQQIAERLRAQQEERKRKEEQNRSQTALLKEKLKEKTTAAKIEQNFNNRQNESLQERKKRLAEIRMLHKPIDRKQLDAHAQKLDQIHAERVAAAQANAEVQKTGQKQVLAFYKSIFYKRVKEEPKVYLDKQSQQEVSKLRENRDRLKKFAQNIRENYRPTIDEKKAEQIKFRSVNLRNRSLSTAKHQRDPQKLGLRYLQFSKQQVEHQKLLGASRQEQQEQQKPKKLDYLAELRKANKNRVSQSAHDLLSKLQKGAVSKQEKMKKVLEFTDRIQKTAKRKEQLTKITSGTVVDDELDALYLQAIQAKLGLLEDY